MFVSGFGGVVGDTIDLGEGVSAGGGEATSDRIVWNDGESVAEAGDVVSLAGSEKGDGAVAERFWEIER